MCLPLLTGRQESNAKVAKGTEDAKDKNHRLHRLAQIFSVFSVNFCVLCGFSSIGVNLCQFVDEIEKPVLVGFPMLYSPHLNLRRRKWD